jgi:hypothetical protein
MRNLLILLALGLCFFAATTSAQTYRIYRPCPGTTQTAEVNIVKDGNLVMTPCSGDEIWMGNNTTAGRRNTFPFRMWNRDFVNFQGATCTFCLGDIDPAWGGTVYRDINQSAWAPHYAVDVEPVVSLYNSAPFAAVFGYPRVRVAAGTSSLAYGGSFTVNTYGNGLNGYTGTATLIGVNGNAYVRSQNEVAAYGGYFDAFTGGNLGGTNTTPMYGVLAQAAGGHNGISPLVVGGKFRVYNVGGGGAGTITEGRGISIAMDGGGSTTSFGTTKAIEIGDGYVAANGGTWSTNFGLYITAGFDKASANFPILSLSSGISVFSGPVTGPVNAYDATTWDSSNKFATEDAIRDKFESLGASGVNGSGTASRAAYWTGTSTLAALPLDITSDKFTFFKTATTDAFRAEIKPSTTGAGTVLLGDQSGTGWPYITIDEGVNRIEVESQTVRLGDWQNIGNGTTLEILDASKQFDFSTGSASGGLFRLSDIDTYLMRRTLTGAGTTGAQTINRPAGSVNFAAAATTLVVTNSIAATDSLIFLTPQTADATCKSFAVTRAAGSFTITANAACTAETAVAFMVTN